MTSAAQPHRAITVERIYALHAAGLAHQGQKVVGRTRNDGCVSGAIDNAYNGALYESDDPEPDDLLVAARLLRSLVQNNCFTDGNKRVGWSACVELLALNELTLKVTDDEAVSFVLGVAQGLTDIDAITAWLAERLVALDDG